MKFLSKRFWKIKKSSSSYVREWAETKKKELEYSGEINTQNLFAIMINALVAFGKDSPQTKKFQEMRDIDICEHYSNDASLFEIGCYLFFRIDMWLFLKKPRLREEISRTFVHEFNKLFTEALKIDNIPELFAERVDEYSKLNRNKEDLEEYYFCLSQLILKTNHNTPPQKYDFEKELELDFWGETNIKISLLSWEKHFLPWLIDSLDKLIAERK